MKTIAQAHESAKAEAIKLLTEITNAVNEHAATNWAHVGDMSRVLASLRELSAITASADARN